ncbi:MAG TPA: hypothetical protein VF179_12275 [Thermoanaerobaculia bacterium]|nr:hypothetical protein [Thermoanaerobaculia bacterium]
MKINRRSLLPLILAGAFIAIECPAQQAAPCSAPQHRQFDFWFGDWEVKNAAGNLAGTNRIESILGGCAIQENWQGTRGPNGTSLNLYAPDGKWHQIWVDSQGNLVEVAGGLEEGKMVMRGTAPSQREPGKTVLRRATWTPLDGGRVRQLWEASFDDGKTWTVQFDGMYSRKG